MMETTHHIKATKLNDWWLNTPSQEIASKFAFWRLFPTYSCTQQLRELSNIKRKLNDVGLLDVIFDNCLLHPSIYSETIAATSTTENMINFKRRNSCDAMTCWIKNLNFPKGNHICINSKGVDNNIRKWCWNISYIENAPPSPIFSSAAFSSSSPDIFRI